MGTAVLVAAWLLVWHPTLFGVAVAFLPVYLVLFRRFLGRIRAGTESVRRQLDAVFSHLKTKIDGMLVVKAHAREEEEIKEFAGRIAADHQPRLCVGRLGGLFALLNLSAGGAGAALVFAVGAFQVVAGAMTAGELVAVAALTAMLFGPVSRLADLAALLQQSRVSVARLGELMEQDIDVPEPKDPVPVLRPRGLVEFDRVYFAYRAGHDVLHDISFRLQPGTRAALVGPTGCGKSTLMNLLLRFYDPRAGEIRLDGVALRRLSVADLRRQIGIVPQEVVIFRGTLADKIRYGAPAAGAEDVERAARAALVHDVAAALPQGYATVVGEGAYKPSQGQKQQVAIARAFCKDPALVLLDEATASLDTESEIFTQAALDNLQQGRTSIVIAHRLSTIVDADTVLVLDRGRSVQAGTHDELLAQTGGLYRRLCERQFHLPTLRAEPPGRAAVPAVTVAQPAA